MDDDDDYRYDESSCFQRNILKLFIIACLTLIATASSTTLAVVLIKQSQRQRMLIAKKNIWSVRLEECAPILKFATPIISTIIKVAFSILLL